MITYAESSAIVAWLFDEPHGREMGRLLAGAERVVTSTVTEVECARAIIRAVVAGARTADEGARMSRALSDARGDWTIIELHDEVLSRASQPFPVEPIRTLDAIHVASTLTALDAGDITVLSLDERVRANAGALGLTVLPAKRGAA